MNRSAIHRILSDQEMRLVAETIREKERTTGGEIRVALRVRRHWGEKKLPLHQLALREFHKLGMHKTQLRIGVLIFILLSERRFHIVADEGIQTRVDDGTWNALAATMSSHFREGKFCEGICSTVRSVGEILSEHFPAKSENIDELPNDVSVS
jgi:uncharacterized membrane protein